MYQRIANKADVGYVAAIRRRMTNHTALEACVPTVGDNRSFETVVEA